MRLSPTLKTGNPHGASSYVRGKESASSRILSASHSTFTPPFSRLAGTGGQDFDEVKRLVAGVPGWLTPNEGHALYEAARACTGRGVIVEIGSWKGKSTICLARGLEGWVG